MPESPRLQPEVQPSQTALGQHSPVGVRRLSAVHFLVALILLLVTLPFVDQLPNGALVESVLLTLVLLSAVMAVGGRRNSLIVGVVLVTPAVLGRWIDHFRPDLIPADLSLVAAIVFVVFVIVHLLRFIMRAPRVNDEVLCAGLSTYLMLGVLWMFAYTLVARLVPGSFAFTDGPGPNRSMAGFEAMFFSFGTLTNINYGETIPVSRIARLLALAEATTSMFFVTVLIARLVSLYSENEPTQIP